MEAKRVLPQVCESSVKRARSSLPPPPTVVCLRRKGGIVTQDCDVYIGRKVLQGGWNLPWSEWANPFKVGGPAGGDALGPRLCINDVLQRYEQRIRSRPDLMAKISSLSGKRLGCWCKPRACHGDVLVRLYNEWLAALEESDVTACHAEKIAPSNSPSPADLCTEGAAV